MLSELQVNHPHLDGAGSNAIVYAVRYPDHVLFIRTDTHIHPDELPPSKRLNQLGRRRFERGVAAKLAERRPAVTRSVTALLAPMKPKPDT